MLPAAVALKGRFGRLGRSQESAVGSAPGSPSDLYRPAVSFSVRRVLITGAAGRIGRTIAPLLPSEWELRRTDVLSGHDLERLDVRDLDACREAFTGIDAVVHLAAEPEPTAGWESLMPANVVGMYNVAQAAVECGVRRLVLASSMHAVSAQLESTQSRVDDPPRPGNLYGATKAWGEALGAWVATTSQTSVVALRIGYFAEERPDPRNALPMDAASWLSVRDAAELVRAAVDAEGVSFTVANGVSANRHRVADLQATMQRIGYRPVDDAWAP